MSCLSSDELCSKLKSKNVAYPRQIAMYLCRTLLSISLNEIGQVLGGRDHTTVIHGIEKITADLEEEKKLGISDLTNRIELIKKKLNP